MKLKTYLFCDEIRHELSGKFSLMGVFNDQLVIDYSPLIKPETRVPMRLATFLKIAFETQDKKPNKFDFQLLMNSNLIVDITNEHLALEKDAIQVNIMLNGEGIPIQMGDLGFKITLKHDSEQIFTEEVPCALVIRTAPKPISS